MSRINSGTRRLGPGDQRLACCGMGNWMAGRQCRQRKSHQEDAGASAQHRPPAARQDVQGGGEPTVTLVVSGAETQERSGLLPAGAETRGHHRTRGRRVKGERGWVQRGRT